jgi:AcrR family transcriptional regulator
MYCLGMTVTSGALSGHAVADSKGERTRSAILDASRQLFLERGYAGTPINAITAACGISRAGFYTYFKDKREVFNVIGETVYRDLLAVLAQWETGVPLAEVGLRELVERYFDFLDRHGAFVMASAHSAPTDETFRRSRDRMVARAAWILGHIIGGTREHGHSPEVVGVAATAVMERSWYSVQTQSVHVERDEMIAVVAEMISAMTAKRAQTQTS